MLNIRTKMIAAVLAMGMLLGGMWAVAFAQDATPAASGEVIREVLSSTEPESAPGEVFELVRYTIPAGAVLPIHTHPGVQMATVESGTLTYHVIENGSITVTRADDSEEEVGPGESVTLTVGDAWVEPEGMVHYAENLTSEPVVLMSSSLLEEGEPAAEVVDVATPAP